MRKGSTGERPRETRSWVMTINVLSLVRMFSLGPPVNVVNRILYSLRHLMIKEHGGSNSARGSPVALSSRLMMDQMIVEEAKLSSPSQCTHTYMSSNLQ